MSSRRVIGCAKTTALLGASVRCFSFDIGRGRALTRRVRAVGSCNVRRWHLTVVLGRGGLCFCAASVPARGRKAAVTDYAGSADSAESPFERRAS